MTNGRAVAKCCVNKNGRKFITRIAIAENNPSSITPIAFSPRGWQADEKFLQYDGLLEQRQRAKRIGTTGSR